jgi:WS/DGAT/MGAT family acyltransferase
VETVTGAARTALSLARELRPLPTSGPFDGRVGQRRAVAFAQCSLDDLRAIEHAAGEGVTVNDVVLASVAGSIRRWCQEHGGALERARVKVPVSMHSSGPHADDGNRDSFMFVDLPLDEPDAHARLRAVNRETRDRKTHHDADAVFQVLGTLERVAPPVARLAGRVLQNPREFAVNVSNVPGPRSEVRVLGLQVRELYSLAEIAERHPLRVTAVSLAGTMQFGFCVDPDLVPGVESLASGVEASITELLGNLR